MRSKEEIKKLIERLLRNNNLTLVSLQAIDKGEYWLHFKEVSQ